MNSFCERELLIPTDDPWMRQSSMIAFDVQVIAVICVLVWVINIGRFNDPLHGGWVRDSRHETFPRTYSEIAIGVVLYAHILPEQAITTAESACKRC